MSSIKTLNNGINTFVNDSNKTMHQCMYCETWFYPKRRFMQKFCSESCRVLACRHRKKDLFGMQGGQLKDRNKTTNSQLKMQLESLKEQIETLGDDTNDLATNTRNLVNEKSGNQTRILQNLENRILELQIKQERTLRLQKWQIFLNVAMPLISPKLLDIVKNIFSSDNPVETMEEFNKKLDPVLKDVPDDLRDSLINSAKNYYNAFGSAGFNAV
jgi:uncharacterized protein (UPF0335 family)